MSLQQLKKEELQKLAHKFEVEIDESTTKPEIINLLQEAEVTYSTYKKFFVDGENAGQQDDEDGVNPLSFDAKPCLLKMERLNTLYEAYGRTFTREHPYVVMSEDEAQNIIDNHEGFRLASPGEAKAYYG